MTTIGGVSLGELQRLAAVAAGLAVLPGVDLADLRQQVLADLLAVARQSAAVENPTGYLWRVAQQAARFAVAGWLPPVSVSHRERRRAALSIRRVEVVESTAVCDWQDTAEAQVGARELQARTSARLSALLADLPAQEQSIARATLLDEQRPRHVAAAHAVPVTRVYVITDRIRARILRDAEMRALYAAQRED